MYGCFNRADYVPTITMQDGWYERPLSDSPPTRIPRMVKVPFRMSPRCEYTATSELGQAGQRCIGCARRAPALDAAQ